MESDNIIEKSIDLEEKLLLKKERLTLADSEFIKALESYLKMRPELKKRYEEKISTHIEEIHKNKNTSLNVEISSEVDISDEDLLETEIIDITTDEKKEVIIYEKKEENEDLKKTYREIVKTIHPDKISQKSYTKKQMLKMSEYYETATVAYKNKELMPLVRICAILYLPLNLSDESLDELEKQITFYEKKILYIESAFVWCWYHAPTQGIKDQMLDMFLNKTLNK